jgi:excisionase family DNA binding protein
MSKDISTTEAAKRLDVTRQHVIRLIKEGKLEARKIGNYYAITLASVERYKRDVQGR